MYLLPEAAQDAPPPGSGEMLGQIGRGLVILLGVRLGDTLDDARGLATKVATLRIFDDAGGRLNLSVLDVAGEALSVPQFTLYADTRRGRRPSFVEAAPPDQAETLFWEFNRHLEAAGVRVVPGRFRAHMIVEIHNDGPVTVLLDAPVQ